jgi:hypothetical protein
MADIRSSRTRVADVVQQHPGAFYNVTFTYSVFLFHVEQNVQASASSRA